MSISSDNVMTFYCFYKKTLKKKGKKEGKKEGRMLNIKINSQIIPGFEYLVLLHPSLEGTQHLQFQTVLIELHRWEKISPFQNIYQQSYFYNLLQQPIQ